MKRIILFLVFVVSLQTTMLAGNDKPIDINQLPETAQQFIQKHFSNEKISIAKMETEFFDKSYEIFFVNGNKIEFDKKGNWTEINCKFSEVPGGVIPQKIRDHVTSNYSESKVIEIDRDKHDYEVKLSNGLELKFDLKFNLIDIDN